MKGIAVPYIVALLLGIIVLGIIVYLVYLHIILKQPLSCQECGAKFVNWCAKCFLKEWGGDNEMDEELKDCVPRCNLGIAREGGNECVGAEEDCKAVGIPP